MNSLVEWRKRCVQKNSWDPCAACPGQRWRTQAGVGARVAMSLGGSSARRRYPSSLLRYEARRHGLAAEPLPIPSISSTRLGCSADHQSPLDLLTCTRADQAFA